MKKFFKKQKSFQKKKESFWLNINLYWKLAVCFVFVMDVVAYFFGYYLFVRVNKEFILPHGAESGQVKTVKKERIDKILEYFSSRKQRSAEILNSPAPVVDPSL